MNAHIRAAFDSGRSCFVAMGQFVRRERQDCLGVRWRDPQPVLVRVNPFERDTRRQPLAYRCTKRFTRPRGWDRGEGRDRTHVANRLGILRILRPKTASTRPGWVQSRKLDRATRLDSVVCIGGEGGIRTRRDSLDSVSSRFHVATIAVDASIAVAPCTLLHPRLRFDVEVGHHRAESRRASSISPTSGFSIST
jgi:hypothetical protein